MDIVARISQLIDYFYAYRVDQIFFSEVIPPVLVVLMFGMGMSLKIADLTRVVLMPKAVLLGLTGQLLLLPLIAFSLVWLLQPAPAVAVGAVILAACPGGITSNAYVFSARGDIALSITLTVVASFVTVFSIPLLTNIVLDEFLSDQSLLKLDFWETVWLLARLTILPVAAGMVIKAYRPAWADRLVEVFRRITFILLLTIVLVAILGALKDFAQNFATAGIIAIALNVTAMTAGFFLARAGRLSAVQSMTITFEVGVQNLALTALVVLTLLQRPDFFVFTVVYSLVMKVTAFSLLAIAPKIVSRSTDLTSTNRPQHD